MGAKKKETRAKTHGQKTHLSLVDPLEVGTVTFACDLYPEYSSSLAAMAKNLTKRSKSHSKKRVA